MRTIPRAPARLRLEIEKLWSGAPCDAPLRGAVELAREGDALAIRAELIQPGPPHLPDAPAGARVDGLWRYDVVECFLVGEGGRYLEVELGAGGHFLVLEFSAPRALADAHESLRPRVECARRGDAWSASLSLPIALVPSGLRAANAFAIACGRFLAHHPVPGDEPDFHQPGAYPAVRLAEE